MPAGGGGASTRATRGLEERGVNDVQQLPRDGGRECFVLASCSCEVHCLCALGFAEDASPRAMSNGARQVTCRALNPALQ